MNSAEASLVQQPAVEADFVAEYLRSNPDFLESHPDILNGLQLSHHQQGAVSLIERQIRLLREQNEQQRSRLDSLMEIAHSNDGINRQLHRLTLQLMLCTQDEDLFQVLITNLREEFQVERVICQRLDEALLAQHPFLSQLLHDGQPKCGRFSKDQLAPLFGEDALRIRSAVLVPLKDQGVAGVFALAEEDEHRYHPGMATDYLARLGELVARLLRRNAAAG